MCLVSLNSPKSPFYRTHGAHGPGRRRRSSSRRDHGRTEHVTVVTLRRASHHGPGHPEPVTWFRHHNGQRTKPPPTPSTAYRQSPAPRRPVRSRFMPRLAADERLPPYSPMTAHEPRSLPCRRRASPPEQTFPTLFGTSDLGPSRMRHVEVALVAWSVRLGFSNLSLLWTARRSRRGGESPGRARSMDAAGSLKAA